MQVIETQARGLLARGHEVTVATTDVLDHDHRLPPDAAAVPPGVTVRRFANRSHRLAMRTSAWTPRGWLPWIRANAGSFDVIHLHDIYSVLSAGAAGAARRAGVPYVLQPHGSAAITTERGKPLAKRAFMALWGNRTLAGAAAVLYGSEEERSILLAAGAPEVRLVESPPPLDLPDVSLVAEASEPTVAFLGRLDPIKGVDRLLRAVALARREIPALRLEIMGSGEREHRRLARVADELGIAPAVRFRGMVLGQEKFDALARAHLFCLLSHSEGLPVAAVEAMGCGTPVVLSEGCHLREAHDRAGVVVPGAPDGAAAAIVSLLRDPERRRRLADGAVAFADRFRADRVTADLDALFASLATSALAGKP